MLDFNFGLWDYSIPLIQCVDDTVFHKVYGFAINLMLIRTNHLGNRIKCLIVHY